MSGSVTVMPEKEPGETGAWIRRRREEVGLTQEELARLAGVTGKTVWRYETGRQQDGGSAERKIRRALIRPRVESLAISVGQLAKGMGVNTQQAEKILGEDSGIGYVLVQRAHHALDEIERRLSVSDDLMDQLDERVPPGQATPRTDRTAGSDLNAG